MYGALIGLATAGAGTGLSMYGADRKRKAMNAANAAYMDALDKEAGRVEGRTADDVQRYGDWSLADQADTDADIRGMLAAPQAEAVDPRAFMANTQQAIARGRQVAPVQGVVGVQPTTAQQQWGAAVGGQNQQKLGRFQRGMARDWSERKAADDQDAVMTERAIRRLLQARSRADVESRMQLDNMIGQLAWARQQRALQARMNQASGTGAEQMMYGQLLQQGGGTMMSMDGGQSSNA